MSSEVDNEAARIVGMPFRSDMLAVVKAVLLARDAAIADCRVAVNEITLLREHCAMRPANPAQDQVFNAMAATDAAGLLEKYK